MVNIYIYINKFFSVAEKSHHEVEVLSLASLWTSCFVWNADELFNLCSPPIPPAMFWAPPVRSFTLEYFDSLPKPAFFRQPESIPTLHILLYALYKKPTSKESTHLEAHSQALSLFFFQRKAEKQQVSYCARRNFGPLISLPVADSDWFGFGSLEKQNSWNLPGFQRNSKRFRTHRRPKSTFWDPQVRIDQSFELMDQGFWRPATTEGILRPGESWDSSNIRWVCQLAAAKAGLAR